MQRRDRFWMSIVSRIPIDSDGILMWDYFHWFPYEIIFPSICGSSKTESVCDLGVHFTTRCSWSMRWTRTWHGLDLQFGLRALACQLRGRTSLGILWLLSTCLGVFWLGSGSQGRLARPHDVLAPGRNNNKKSWWFRGLFDVILRWDQIHLKAYQTSFSIKCSLTSTTLRMKKLRPFQ